MYTVKPCYSIPPLEELLWNWSFYPYLQSRGGGYIGITLSVHLSTIDIGESYHSCSIPAEADGEATRVL